MYANMYDDDDMDWGYESGIISVSLKNLQTYAVQISDDVKDSDRRSHHACIPTAVFDPLHHINDPQLLEGDRTMWDPEIESKRQANVEFVQRLFQRFLCTGNDEI